MTTAHADEDSMGSTERPCAPDSSGRTFPVNDYALERIIYRAPHAALTPIPWPGGLAPAGVAYDRSADQPLPRGVDGKSRFRSLLRTV